MSERPTGRLARVALLALWSLAPGAAAGEPEPGLQSLYDSNSWFELRDRVASGKAPGFYRAAVAAAFHDVDRAKAELKRVIRAAPRSEEAYEAHEMLANLHLRLGRSRDVLAHVDAMLALKPNSPDARATRPLFAALGRFPAQSVARHRAGAIRCSIEQGNLRVPVAVNGVGARYILDTGANYSLISESEAGRIGLAVRDVDARMADSTGHGVGFRVGVAGEVEIGDVRLRHVVFLVVRDDQQPFVELPPGERGVIGLPVLLALRAIRWDRDGTLQIHAGSPSHDLRRSNLFFDGAMPVVRAAFGGGEIVLQLDTGAARTDLWPRFGRDFAAVVAASAERGSRRVTGIGSSVEAGAMVLPEVTLRIGGFDAVLRPASVLLEPMGQGGEDYHGRLGMDLLAQAHRVDLDFQAMTLKLE